LKEVFEAFAEGPDIDVEDHDPGLGPVLLDQQASLMVFMQQMLLQ